MKKNNVMALLAIMLVGVVATSFAVALPKNGMLSKNNELMVQALDAEDYDAFLVALQQDDRGTKMAEIMTEEKFQYMVKRHQQHQAVEDALEAQDYDAWITATADMPHREDMATVITADNFDLFVEMHQAREAEDFATAHDLAEEIGLPMGPKNGLGRHGSFANGEFKGQGMHEGGCPFAESE